MAIEDLTKSILSDAEAEVARIAGEANTKRESIRVDAEGERRAAKSLFEDETAKMLADSERRIVSSAAQEAKIALDKEKRDALENVFSAAYTKLKNVDDAKYESIILPQLESLPKDIRGVLYTAKNRVSITEKALKKAGIDLDIQASDSIEGGFTIVSEDFEYDFTFGKAIADKKNELEIAIAEILFS